MRHQLHAEWTKLRTAPGTAWLLAGVVAATVAVSALATGTVVCATGHDCGVDPVKLSLTGILLGQAVVAILAVLAVGSEYSTGMARLTYTAMPRRLTVLAAKATVVTALVLGAAAVAVPASLITGRLLLGGQGYPAASAVLRAGAGSVLYLGLIALLSLGLATAMRSSAAAIGTVLGLLFVVPLLAQVLSDPQWRRHLDQAAPMSAGLAIQATRDLDQLPLSPWAGLGVLALWACGALLLGALVLRGRDV